MNTPTVRDIKRRKMDAPMTEVRGLIVQSARKTDVRTAEKRGCQLEVDCLGGRDDS